MSQRQPARLHQASPSISVTDVSASENRLDITTLVEANQELSILEVNVGEDSSSPTDIEFQRQRMTDVLVNGSRVDVWTFHFDIPVGQEGVAAYTALANDSQGDSIGQDFGQITVPGPTDGGNGGNGNGGGIDQATLLLLGVGLAAAWRFTRD